MLTFPSERRLNLEPAPKDRKSPEFREWRIRNSDRYGDSGKDVTEEGDYRASQTAVALLEDFAKTKTRFFLSMHQARPHTPLVAPKKYVDMYDPWYGEPYEPPYVVLYVVP